MWSIQSLRAQIKMLLVMWAITAVSMLRAICQQPQQVVIDVLVATKSASLSLARNALLREKSWPPTASSTTVTAADAAPMDLIVVTYSTKPIKQELFFRSIQAQLQQPTFNDTKVIHVGAGISLMVNNSFDWMFRFRTVVQAIQDEIMARKGVDYVVLVGDARDAYLATTTTTRNGITTNTSWSQRLIERFEEFNASIVLSGQIFCCNPMSLLEVAIPAWDDHYASIGGPPTMYKYLNAGIFVGYASAILSMAHEMNVWEHQSYTALPHYEDLVKRNGVASLQFKDVDINDDEWLMSQWYLKDQQKAQPMAKLDVHHALLATTPTVRARNDKNRDGRNYFTIFAADTFARYVGLWPPSFPRSDLERITMCPYRHDMATGTWTNELTQGQPLVFHFAGNDWICACQVLLTEYFTGHTSFIRVLLITSTGRKRSNAGLSKRRGPPILHET
jgi:hypothetical protein